MLSTWILGFWKSWYSDSIIPWLSVLNRRCFDSRNYFQNKLKKILIFGHNFVYINYTLQIFFNRRSCRPLSYKFPNTVSNLISHSATFMIGYSRLRFDLIFYSIEVKIKSIVKGKYLHEMIISQIRTERVISYSWLIYLFLPLHGIMPSMYTSYNSIYYSINMSELISVLYFLFFFLSFAVGSHDLN